MSSSPADTLFTSRGVGRLALARRLGRDLPSLAAALGSPVEGMPFRLGEGPRDWTLPYAWDDQIDGLASILVERLCEAITGRRPGGGAASARYGLRRGLSKLGARSVTLAAELDPNLDPSLMHAIWDSVGSTLAGALHGALRRALEAELASANRPPFAYLAALAASFLPVRVKAQPSRGLPFERVEKAVGFAFFALVQAAAESAVEEIAARPVPIEPGRSCERLLLALDPLSYCSIRSRALQNDLNPWGLGEKPADALDSKVRSSEASPWEQQEREISDQAAADARLREELAAVGRRARCREVLLPLLLELDRGGEEPWAEARAALASDEALDAFRADAKGSSTMVGNGGGPRALALWQPLIGDAGDPEDLRRGVDALLLWRIDRALAGPLDRAARSLRDERGVAAPGDLAPLHERGRLYRLSGDGQPLLRISAARETGFLFVDLKGFTQRTVRSKELAVADFLQREFYEPILEAARAVSQRSGGGLRLLNLVGDAAAFSGETAALVELAAEVRGVCVAYEQKLQDLAPPAKRVDFEAQRRNLELQQAAAEEPLLLERTLLEGELARKGALSPEQLWPELERQIAARNAQLSSAFQAITAQLPGAPEASKPALQLELQRISRAEEKLVSGARQALQHVESQSAEEKAAAVLELLTGRERSRMQEIDGALEALRQRHEQELAALARSAQAEGSGLVAGVFISFGASAEEIRMPDPLFGEVRVSVAEKLNEAARGTGRSARVLAEVDELARLLSFKRGGAPLKSPFLVHLDAAEAGKPASEIYNGGQALSGEALDAFLRTTAGARFHFQRLVAPADLAEEIAQKLLLPESFRLIVSVPATLEIAGALAFRRVGRVVFRGFEEAGPCEVYELLAADGQLMRMLARNHLARWVQEARGALRQQLASLPRED
ncbi:MAG: coiled-coil domain-containing protein [Myxococcales bacterium]